MIEPDEIFSDLFTSGMTGSIFLPFEFPRDDFVEKVKRKPSNGIGPDVFFDFLLRALVPTQCLSSSSKCARNFFDIRHPRRARRCFLPSYVRPLHTSSISIFIEFVRVL